MLSPGPAGLERATLNVEQIRPGRQIFNLAEDVRMGLFNKPRVLPAKYFYDVRGSQLFDQICDTPEYYPTRTEDALLAEYADLLIAAAKPESIMELGAGTSRKTKHLLDACDAQHRYVAYEPFDVCREVMEASGLALAERYRWMELRLLVGDYTGGLQNLPVSKARRLVVFLGGTIGNFSEIEAAVFLREIRDMLGPEDSLLIGADRIKEPELLHAAYNDSAGLTAAFNLNVLNVINRELNAEFDIDRFTHYACFNPNESRIEMYLVSMGSQRIRIGELDATLEFADGDHILTEVSRKYTRAGLEAELVEAGFEIETHYEAAKQGFSLVLATAA